MEKIKEIIRLGREMSVVDRFGVFGIGICILVIDFLIARMLFLPGDMEIWLRRGLEGTHWLVRSVDISIFVTVVPCLAVGATMLTVLYLDLLHTLIHRLITPIDTQANNSGRIGRDQAMEKCRRDGAVMEGWGGDVMEKIKLSGQKINVISKVLATIIFLTACAYAAAAMVQGFLGGAK